MLPLLRKYASGRSSRARELNRHAGRSLYARRLAIEQLESRLLLAGSFVTDRFEAFDGNDSSSRAWNFNTLSGRWNFDRLSIHDPIDIDWYRFNIAATGTIADQVAVKYLVDGAADRMLMTLFQFNTAFGGTLIQVSDSQETFLGQASISLAGLPSGDYFLRFTAEDPVPEERVVPRYYLTIDAPGVTMAADYAGTNDSAQKAFELPSIGESPEFTGLFLTAGQSDWFKFDTPPIANPGATTIRIRSSSNDSITVNLRDSTEVILASASGSGLVELEQTLGPGASFFLEITSTSPVDLNYAIDFQLPDPPATTPGPQVADVLVLGQSGPPEFLNQLQSNGLGDGDSDGFVDGAGFSIRSDFVGLQLPGQESKITDVFASAQTISPNATVEGAIDSSDDVDYFSLAIPESGRLTIRVEPTDASSLDPQVSLIGPDGQLLVISDDAAVGDSAAFLQQHVSGTGDGSFALEVGSYVLAVSAVANTETTGRYTLSTSFTTAALPFVDIAVGDGPRGIVTADFNGDGRLDLATANQDSDDVSILLGSGDGSFAPETRFAVGDSPIAIVTGDFNSDGRLDLATANRSDDVSILLGTGDGSFAAETRFTVGNRPEAIVTADFNGDGRLDLATLNLSSFDVSILLGTGDGSFSAETRFAIRDRPTAMVTGDFNGDGRLDLAAANDHGFRRDDDLSILLGTGDGSFAPAVRFTVGSGVSDIVTGDFNGDGRLDLATSNEDSDDVSILLGTGDGRFGAETLFGVGIDPRAIVTADFNSDGRPDLATANEASDDVSILLASRDGSLAVEVRFAVGDGPRAIVTGDFNGDGRLDLATANNGFLSDFEGSISILLGIGDGNLTAETRFAVGRFALAIVTGDFNDDGRLDLATANFLSDDVSILLGIGDGSFGPETRLAVGDRPYFIVMGDFSGDGHLDLAAANANSDDVSILLGIGDGSFKAETRFAVGVLPTAIVTGDFNDDGHLDLATANGFSDDVSILLGNGDGSFTPETRFVVGGPIRRAIAAGDFNGDGALDLATADNRDISILFGTGDESFGPETRFPVGELPLGIVTDDFNGDGLLDLATANVLSSDVSILLGASDGSFVPGSRTSGASSTALLLADFDGDDARDAILVNQEGEILIRFGQPGGKGTFEPPIVINPDFPARDVAIVATPAGTVLAALGASDSISLYTLDGQRQFARSDGPSTGFLSTQIESADLNGDDFGDLVVLNAGSGDLSIFLADAVGGFNCLYGSAAQEQSRRCELEPITAGNAPSRIALVDPGGSRAAHILVTNARSGDVSLFLNDGSGGFASELRYRASDNGPFGIETFDGTQTVLSGQATRGVAVGDFNGDDLPDVVVANSGTNTFSLLLGKQNGGLVDPVTFATRSQPTAVDVGDFNGDGHLDVAVLNEGSDDISVFTSVFTVEAFSGFEETFFADAGNSPTGLSVDDANGDDILDLLVGNEFGDLLILLGNKATDEDGQPLKHGDGTFQSFQRAGQAVTLAVADLDGDGIDDVVTASESLDRVELKFGQGGTEFQEGFAQDRDDGLLAPGAVQLVDLNNDDQLDLVLANQGGNDVLVYLRQVGGGFGEKMSFFAGTNPAGVTARDVTGDGFLDLVVANEGSNDVSILFSDLDDAGQWQGLSLGPRLPTGQGPVSTELSDQTGDGIVDLLVTNRQDGTISLLPGVGAGFFDDQSAIPIEDRDIFLLPGPTVPQGTKGLWQWTTERSSPSFGPTCPPASAVAF